MGRPYSPITSSNPHLSELAHLMRRILTEEGLTFQEVADRAGDISRITFQRAASGTYIPKEKTLTAFTKACNRPDELRKLLHLRVQARIEERGRLRELRAPRPHLISDRPDLSRALEWLYEAAGAPTLQEIQVRSGEPYVLPTSTIQRIITRESTPVDLQQLLAFVRGCGYDGQEKIWTDVWNRISFPELEAAVYTAGDPVIPTKKHLPVSVRARTVATKEGLVVKAEKDGGVTVMPPERPLLRSTLKKQLTALAGHLAVSEPELVLALVSAGTSTFRRAR